MSEWSWGNAVPAELMQLNTVVALVLGAFLLGSLLAVLIALLIYRRRFADMTTQHALTQQAQAQAEGDLGTTRQTLNDVQQELREANERINGLDKSLSVERSQTESLTHQASELRERLRQTEQQVTTLNNTLTLTKEESASREQQWKAEERKSHDLTERLSQSQAKSDVISADYAQLQVDYAALKSQFFEQKEHIQQLTTQLQTQFQEQKGLLAKEFENLAHKIFDEKGKRFSEHSHDTLNVMLKPFREQISEFRQRVDTLHKEANESHVSLKAQLEHIKTLNQQVTEDAQNLTKALKGDKKLSGSWGEIQLERSLQQAGLVSGDHYSREEVFRTQEGAQRRPDFVIHLPDGKHIVIDSKVSLVDYDSAVSAEGEDDRARFLENHIKAVKRHIDSLAAKDYSNLLGVRSPNFVLMFMPVEPAYIEALKHNKELFNYGFEKNIILVSHTTLMPLLRTVANLWMMERSNSEARELGTKAGEIYNQVCLVAERLQALGKSLSASSNHYNKTVLALAGKQGLHGKVDRFAELAKNVTKSMPDIELQHLDFDTDKLSLSAEELPQLENDEPIASLE